MTATELQQIEVAIRTEAFDVEREGRSIEAGRLHAAADILNGIFEDRDRDEESSDAS